MSNLDLLHCENSFCLNCIPCKCELQLWRGQLYTYPQGLYKLTSLLFTCYGKRDLYLMKVTSLKKLSPLVRRLTGLVGAFLMDASVQVISMLVVPTSLLLLGRMPLTILWSTLKPGLSVTTNRFAPE